MKKNAFTLIEILIVVGVVMVIMVSITGIMSGIFTSQNKNTAIDKLTQNGDWVLGELKKNVINADKSGEDGEKFDCPNIGTYGSSITITNIKDGNKTTISCIGNDKIASISATAIGTTTTTYLFQDRNDFTLSTCSEFVICSTLPSLELSDVKFKFTLKSGKESAETSKEFSIDITLRN